MQRVFVGWVLFVSVVGFDMIAETSANSSVQLDARIGSVVGFITIVVLFVYYGHQTVSNTYDE